MYAHYNTKTVYLSHGRFTYDPQQKDSDVSLATAQIHTLKMLSVSVNLGTKKWPSI